MLINNLEYKSKRTDEFQLFIIIKPLLKNIQIIGTCTINDKHSGSQNDNAECENDSQSNHHHKSTNLPSI
jgi:hypothetical protein